MPEITGIGTSSERIRQRLIERLVAMGITNDKLLGVLADVPRQHFVQEAFAHKSYENIALPIGRGQTISQLTTVARMTELIMNVDGKKVLEIGTGCGYQTAVLSQLFSDVYTVERIKTLQQQARVRLRQLKITNIRFRHGDGWEGWKENSPFDAIIVTAGAETVPEMLCEQLAVGGVLVCPTGEPESQKLCKIVRHEDGLEREYLDSVRFVPLIKGNIEI